MMRVEVDAPNAGARLDRLVAGFEGIGSRTEAASAPDGALVQWLARVHETTTWTTSVCTGALILGAAGILDGLPATTHSYLARAAESLSEAITTTDVPTRYACAHVAALRAAAALLAARAHPTPTRGRRQKNAWVLLAEVAPELAEWAAFFAAGAANMRRGRASNPSPQASTP